MGRTDRFLHFKYNGVSSKEYDAFYVNNGEDITFPFSQKVSHQTSSPIYQNRNYWLGSSRESRSFEMSVAIPNKTIQEIEDVFEWLSPGKPGTLTLDFRPNYEYKVLISSISSPVLIPREFKNGLVTNLVLFSVSFETYETHLAETITSYSASLATAADSPVLFEPDSLYPILFNKGGKYDLVNWSSENQFLNIEADGSAVSVTKTDANGVNKYYDYSLPSVQKARINTEMGSVSVGNKLIEMAYPKSIINSKGPMPIEPGTVFSGNIKITVDSSLSTATVPVGNRFKGIGQSKKFVLVIDKKIDDNTEMVEFDRDKGHPVSGMYPGKLVDGEPKLSNPIYLEGTLSGSNIVFDTKGKITKTDSYNIKIAAVAKVEVVSQSNSIRFKYRKGV